MATPGLGDHGPLSRSLGPIPDTWDDLFIRRYLHAFGPYRNTCSRCGRDRDEVLDDPTISCIPHRGDIGHPIKRLRVPA